MYKVDLDQKKLIQLSPERFSNLGILERFDIQEWIEKQPDILGEPLLVIAKELPLPSGIRLDLLAIDKKANLVIIELKRTLNLDLVLQAVARLAMTSIVYIAVPRRCSSLKKRRKPVLKLMFGAMIRAAERWRRIVFTDFETRQITALRKQLEEDYRTANSLDTPSSATTAPMKIPSTLRT